MHMAYIQRSSAVYTLILRVDSELAAADRFVEETRGPCQHWWPRIRNTEMDALVYVISGM